eukprot:350975_1
MEYYPMNLLLNILVKYIHHGDGMKCDLQKQVSRALTDVPELPDFFNIILEGHSNDPDGYDLLFIDPIKKGNFVSMVDDNGRKQIILHNHGRKQIIFDVDITRY